MKLQSIDVDGFGVLANASFSDIDGGLNVIYGANGSGKTTLLHFVRGLLCGFSESRRIGLLPRIAGGTGDGPLPRGGSLRGNWDGDDCRFARSEESDQLRVTLLQNDQETTHPRFDESRIRIDLVRWLYTASRAESHTVDDLVQQAVDDGIPLLSRRNNSERLNRAAADVHRERSDLLRGTGGGRVAELANERQRAQAELHRLTDELRQRCEQWESRSAPSPVGDLVPEQSGLTWLRDELAAAQSDLREAEDQTWSRRRPAARRTPKTTTPVTPSSGHRKPQRREHIDVRRIPLLEQLDRRIDHARAVLAEAARARLDMNLRSARIAGSADTPAEPFLKRMRDSLASLETGVLDLRDTADTLSEERGPGACACDEWESNSREAVRELSRRIDQLCGQVSRFELNHEKSVLCGATTTIDDCELALRKHLEALRAERSALLDESHGLRAWAGSLRAKAEHDQCLCIEHDVRSGGVRPKHHVTPTTANPGSEVKRDGMRPSRAELDRLRRRCDGLRDELASALVRWRGARNRRPRLHLPADIPMLERQIDEKRIELGTIEASLADSQQRWRVLSATGEVIRRVVERMEREQTPAVVQWASQYLDRLTAGRNVEVGVSPDDHAITVVDADGGSRPLSALSRGTLDQLELSLRLALLRAYAARGARFPLVLDDILVDTDQQRLRAAVELLTEFARQQDQQIIYLTCQTHLADLFERRGAPVRTMPGSTRLSHRMVTGSEQPAGAIRGWVDRNAGSGVIPAEPTTIERPISLDHEEPAATPAEADSRNVRLLKPLKRRQPDGPYWLSLDAPIDLVPSVGSQMGRRLSGLGVFTVADLIDLDADELSLRLASLQITPERLRDWQAEAELLCCVPDLAGPDAQLLAICGIRDADDLSGADLDRLLQQMVPFSNADSALVGQTRTPSREVVQRWILSSRRARSLRDARRFSRSRGRKVRGRRRSVRQGQRRRTSTAQRRGQSSRMSRGRRGENRPSRRRTDRRESREAVIQPFVPAESAVSGRQDPVDLRFYLSPESPLVEAPSIGPTTSKRLEKIGVLTVADLLNRDAEEIATRLKNRRVKKETVVRWQQQAKLMCRIPQLRGHDAQVLVACGLTEPEQLANMAPSALFAVVGPFVATKEGQRLLRSSRTPDLEEVTDWIRWARHSRHLRAA